MLSGWFLRNVVARVSPAENAPSPRGTHYTCVDIYGAFGGNQRNLWIHLIAEPFCILRMERIRDALQSKICLIADGLYCGIIT